MPIICEPEKTCALCPRLYQFRTDNIKQYPTWFNAPVPAFGAEDPELLIVGLAPGLRGANRTGRPFTGDYAGDLLFATLLKFGFASGQYLSDPDDGLVLENCRITNAVKCLPPQNKPIGAEIKNCQDFLLAEINSLTSLKLIVTLGSVAHRSLVRAMGGKQKDFKFSHGGVHDLPNKMTLINSYHCSRYNTNTGRLTTEMFEDVFEIVLERLKRV